MTTAPYKQLPIVVRLPQRYSTEIGKLIARCAYIEWRLHQLVYLLLDVTPAEGRIAIRDRREPEYLDMICDLLDLNSFSIPPPVTQLRHDIAACSQFRNLVTHSIWVRHPETHELMAQLTRGQWDRSKLPPGQTLSRQILTEAIPVTLSDLQGAVESTRSISQQLGAFWKQLDEAIARAFRDKSRQLPRQEDRRLDHIAQKLSPPPRSSPA